jgi:hypothetical protein
MRNKFLIYLLIAAFFSACSKDKFAEYNTDPDAVLTINPATEFTTGAIIAHNNDFETYYDFNRNIYQWTQLWVPTAGNAVAFMQNVITSNSNSRSYRYNSFYDREESGVGVAMADVQHLIDVMPAGKKERYIHMRAIAGILHAYYACYVADVQGSIAYTQAFKARYTIPALLTPKYDTQEAFYDTVNSQLKNIVAILKATQPVEQVKLGVNDIYFHGTGDEALNWARAANSLRMKVAFRIMKRKPDVAKTIVTEVLADAAGPINSRDVQWVFKGGAGFVNGGNWAPPESSGEKNLVDFMYAKGDPRIRNIYQKSAFTKDMFDSAQIQGKIPVSETWQTYRGRYASPDASKETNKSFYFGSIAYSYKGAATNTIYSSRIQDGLVDGAYQSLNGLINFPMITYADICFMRAELAVKGITTENASDWYYNGIEASIQDYNQWGSDAKVIGFIAVGANEITTYKAQPGIVFDATNALEQIYLQEYIHLHKNPNEAWALKKRTGYPSPTGVVFQAEIIKSSGVEQAMPRRWPIVYPAAGSLNYDNALSAIKEMQKDAELGDLSDITGRVWWDKK